MYEVPTTPMYIVGSCCILETAFQSIIHYFYGIRYFLVHVCGFSIIGVIKAFSYFIKVKRKSRNLIRIFCTLSL